MIPDNTPAWKTLTTLAADIVAQPLAELAAKPDRFEQFHFATAGILLDLSKQRLNTSILRGLRQLAEEQQLSENIERLFSGAQVNATEAQPALHTALRSPPDQRPAAATGVAETALHAAELVDQIRTGKRLGHTGKAITDVLHIGIGGSHLGPELAVRALSPGETTLPRIHFVANIDGESLSSALAGLDPHRTLFLIASKSMSTLETSVNAMSARSWFVERVNDPGAITRHFVAITANVTAAAAFGISEDNVLQMWDWVGGRYSLWSAVGLPIAIHLGNDAFTDLLAGAHAMDEHFRHTPVDQNLPVLMALTGIWNCNFLGVSNHAILPYSERLSLLPDYLQQLEMESNGKSVHTDGSAVRIHTTPIVWGGRGTNGQHAFHQLLHQGTRSFTADFVLVKDRQSTNDVHHRWLLANGLSQSQAMMVGSKDDDPHKRVAGNHGTTTLVLDGLTPSTLGALLAMYEHKVFCQGVIWGINSFDQWGVELGKRLAMPIYEQLDGKSALLQDASTRGLIEFLRSS